MFGFLRSIGGLLVTAGLALSVSQPMACSGVCGNAHDSGLIQNADGTYYRFSTGGGLSIHTSPALTGPWTYQGTVLSSSVINGATDLWAPDVTLSGDGVYYLYYSVSTFGSLNSAVGLATSTSMNPGTWTDHGAVVSSSTGSAYNAIDGNLIWDGSAFYLNFGSFYGDLYQAPMANPPLSTTGSAYNIEYNSTGSRPSEASYIFTWGDYYYLFFSSGACCGYDQNRPAQGEEYKIMVCRSTYVTGGYVDASGRSCTTQNGGTQVLASHDNIYGPGGQGVYMDPTYGPVVYYHYVDTNIGYGDGDKLLGINQLDFSSGWPVVV